MVRKHDFYQFCVILHAPCVCISLPCENDCLSLRQSKRITAAGNGEISLLIFWKINKAWVMSGGGIKSNVGGCIQRVSCTQKWSSNSEGAVQGHTWKRNRMGIHNPRVDCLPLPETEVGSLAFWGWFQYERWSIGHLSSQATWSIFAPPPTGFPFLQKVFGHDPALFGVELTPESILTSSYFTLQNCRGMDVPKDKGGSTPVSGVPSVGWNLGQWTGPLSSDLGQCSLSPGFRSVRPETTKYSVFLVT